MKDPYKQIALKGGEKLNTYKRRAVVKTKQAVSAEVVEQPAGEPVPPKALDVQKLVGELLDMPMTMPKSESALGTYVASFRERLRMRGYLALAEKWEEQTGKVVRIMQNAVNSQQMYLELQNLFTEIQYDVQINRLDKEMQLMRKKAEHEAMKKKFKEGQLLTPEIEASKPAGSSANLLAGTTEDDT